MSSSAAVTAPVLPAGGEPAYALFAAAIAAAAVLVVLARRFAPRGEHLEPVIAIRPATESSRARGVLRLVLLIALALRVTALDAGLSFDEIDTLVHYARRPLAEIATSFDSQNQHMLYSLCARPFVLLMGNEAAAVRVPAVLFGVASLWALWRFALRVTGELEALCAVAFLALSYHHVWFSQNARGYTGLLCFTLLGSASFVAMLQARASRGIREPLVYGASMALAAWLHATAVIVVVAHFAVWLAFAARRNRAAQELRAPRNAVLRTGGVAGSTPFLLRNVDSAGSRRNRVQPFVGFAFATSFTLVLYALVLPQFVDTLLAPTLPGAETEWKDPLWLAREMLGGLSRGVPGGAVTLAIGGVVALIGMASYARQSVALIGVFVLAPLLMAAALVATHHNLWPRMFFFAAGFAVLVALRGIAVCVRAAMRSSPRVEVATGVAFALVCAASVVSLRHVWAPKQDFGGAVRRLESEVRQGDAVATVGMTTLPCRELYGKNWPDVDNAAQLAALEALHPRTWIVYTTPTHMQAAFPDVLKRVRESYREVEVFWGTLAGCEVIVAVRGG